MIGQAPAPMIGDAVHRRDIGFEVATAFWQASATRNVCHRRLDAPFPPR